MSNETSTLLPVSPSSLVLRPRHKMWQGKRILTTITMVTMVCLIGLFLAAQDFSLSLPSPTTFGNAMIVSQSRLGSSRHDAESRKILLLPAQCAPNRESVVLLIRHCEDGSTKRHKVDSSRHCNPLGYQRAQYFAESFFFGPITQTWPKPSHLYGLSKGQNQRQYETLQPLAQRTGLSIHMLDFGTCTKAMVQAHARDLETWCDEPLADHDDDKDKNNKQANIVTGNNNNNNNTYNQHHVVGNSNHIMVTVVAWKHAYIPKLARALGCDHCPAEWLEEDFDSVWQLHYHWNTGIDTQGYNEPGLHVYASVVKMNFDPLAYEYQQTLHLPSSSRMP